MRYKKDRTGKTTPIRSKDQKLDENNNINFLNSDIKFNDIKINDDLIAVYLEYKKDNQEKDFKKVESKIGKLNYYKIILKDIGINGNIELTFTIVNNISLTINIKFSKKFTHSRATSLLGTLNKFNTKKPIEQVPNKNIPKKIQNNIFDKNVKKIEKKE